jgi:hypothetical protein
MKNQDSPSFRGGERRSTSTTYVSTPKSTSSFPRRTIR